VLPTDTVRTAEYGPPTPSELNARTHQNSVPLGSELVASCDGVVVAAQISGVSGGGGGGPIGR
jgi:hypothetical protein